MTTATQTLTYLDIKATAVRWAAEYGLEDDDMWTHPFTNIRMTITQVLWSLYTERYMSLDGMKLHFDRYANTIEQKRQFEAEQKAAPPVADADRHNDDCNAHRARKQQQRDEWIARYPGYCRACNSYGGRETPGSLCEPPDFIPCEQCAEKHICPRCGARGTNPDAWLTGELLCTACGYVGYGTDHAPVVACCCRLFAALAEEPLELVEHDF